MTRIDGEDRLVQLGLDDNGIRRLRLRIIRANGPNEADDIVQRVCVRALQTSRPPREGSQQAWLSRIADNLIIDQHRHTGKIVIDRSFSIERVPDPDSPFHQIDLRMDLREALKRLEPRERAVIEKIFFSGDSLGDVGGQLDITPNNAGVIKNRALKTLRKIMM